VMDAARIAVITGIRPLGVNRPGLSD
jgi:hypothetical protein